VEHRQTNGKANFRLTSAKKLLAISIALIPLATVWPFQRPAPKTSRLTVDEVSLGRPGPEMVKDTLVSSPDLAHIAYVARRGSEAWVVMDGMEGKHYPDIPSGAFTERGRPREIVFSADGKRVAYVASRDGWYFVVVDGVEGKPFELIGVGAPVFSPDSKRLAYVATQDGKESVVVDGVEDKPYDHITIGPIRFSPDSLHMAYSARRAKSDFVILDGKEIAQADSASPIYFSDDGKRMAFKVTRGEERRVVVDGVEGRPYESLSNQILFSPDGKHVLYRATLNGYQMMVLDGTESKLKGVISENDFGFSPRGGAAYILRDRTGYRVVIDEVASKSYDRIIGEPWFARDGSRVAFAAGLEQRQLVVIDGAEKESFDEIKLRVGFSPDGKRYCYAATRADIQYAIIDGIAAPYEAVQDVLFSPNGKHTAVVGKRSGKWSVDMDGVSGKAYDDGITACRFSPDGEHIAYVAAKEKKQFVSTDGVEGTLYDNVRDLAFVGGKQVVYVAERGGKRLVVVDGVESGEYDSLTIAPDQEDWGRGSPGGIDASMQLRFLAVRSGEYLRVKIKGF
jgi:hypothetical protein